MMEPVSYHNLHQVACDIPRSNDLVFRNVVYDSLVDDNLVRDIDTVFCDKRISDSVVSANPVRTSLQHPYPPESAIQQVPRKRPNPKTTPRPYTLHSIGHTTSPLFRLPIELRRMVYREVFNGSERKIQWKPVRRDPNNRYTEYNQIMVPTNEQFQLLLTCQEVYIEARPWYWCDTAVTCAFFQMRTLMSAIPTFAREDIQVLKDVPPVDGLSPTNPMQLDQFVGHFPRLKYCQLRRHTVHLYCHHDDVPPKSVLANSGSGAFLEIAQSMNTAKPPVFVQRIYVWPVKDRDTVVWAYANHTEGRVHIAAKGSISDDEGFGKVTGPDLIDFTKAINAHKGLEADDENDVHDTSMTDDATVINDVHEDYEGDKPEGVDDISKGDDEDDVCQVDE
ncbi:hypothetical protein INS49_010670 [Diaporthe citri]|uniref:uncharacterized protein n=1 Tax=Diaporthe citri TaxID=83186 RepID=UPI001C8107AE|nr:uncharacterized protein INS49_010670 [Diaporthe citri]KAG6362440.1 hypothetical protein INS49_010670 [Diaporthe citri]